MIQQSQQTKEQRQAFSHTALPETERLPGQTKQLARQGWLDPRVGGDHELRCVVCFPLSLGRSVVVVLDLPIPPFYATCLWIRKFVILAKGVQMRKKGLFTEKTGSVGTARSVPEKLRMHLGVTHELQALALVLERELGLLTLQLNTLAGRV